MSEAGLLRAMARNYNRNNLWDHLDADACTKAANEIDELTKQRDELLAALDYCKAIGSWTELHKHINGVITSVKYIRQMEEPSKTSAMKESEK